MIIGLDVGGTHTDAALVSPEGLLRKVKVSTDETDLFKTVLSGLTQLLEGVDPGRIRRIVLSTTLTTNAVVQQKVAPVAMIVSSGPGIDPENFRICEHYYTVSGSIDHRGREREPVDHDQVRAIKKELSRAGITTIGVVGKFSVRNPSHELMIRDILQTEHSTLFMGHQVSSNLNFPRRIATVHMDAAVFSLHCNFFNAVEKSLKEKGLTIPIQILKADGGTMSLANSMRFPGQTILSGPAASVMGAVSHAPEDQDALVLDIGGTTTDIAILVNRAPLLEPLGIELGNYKSLIRSLKTRSRGIGGDSRVQVSDRKLIIGPERHGPAMAFGGPCPTPTDAMITLGLMEGGDAERAREGVGKIAAQMNLTVQQAAAAIYKNVVAIILDQAMAMVEDINSKPVYTVHEFLEGYKINPTRILLLGGPAAYLAPEIQARSGIATQVIPSNTVANAIGAALAKTTCEVSLLADTEQRLAIAPEEDFSEPITVGYTEDDVIETAYKLLYQKALISGSKPENFEAEVVEFHKFNIVRGFSLRGKIFRTKLQVKPGLIKGYDILSQAAVTIEKAEADRS